MAADIPAAPEVADATDRPTMVRLSAYVDRPLREVVDQLQHTELDRLLTSAAQGALSSRLEVRFHTEAPVWESGTHVLVPVSWTVTGPRRVGTGAGAVSVLTVQSGRHAVTELLADLTAPAEARKDVARVTRRILDEVTKVLESPT